MRSALDIRELSMCLIGRLGWSWPARASWGQLFKHRLGNLGSCLAISLTNKSSGYKDKEGWSMSQYVVITNVCRISCLARKAKTGTHEFPVLVTSRWPPREIAERCLTEGMLQLKILCALHAAVALPIDPESLTRHPRAVCSGRNANVTQDHRSSKLMMVDVDVCNDG